jgi:hypothetical protein
MRLTKIVFFLLLAATVWLGGLEFGVWPGGSGPGERHSTSRISGLVPAAEGIVGRPLTPVSVAGVARRSARRTVRRW